MTTMERPGTDLGSEYNDLTERQREFVARAAAHADDFATRAAEHDREATYPFENIQKLHESGYMRMCLPEQFRGEDASVLELCLSQERLAQGCAATALAANMHAFFSGGASEAYRHGEKAVEMALMAIGHGGLTGGGAISEVESSDPFSFPAGRVERCDGGFRLNGRKVFGSNTPINPMVFFSGALEENGTKTVVMFQFPKETPGVKIIDDWDTMGMRGTGSFTVEFKECVVPEMFALQSWPYASGLEENDFSRTFLCWFAPSIAAVYTGIAVGARDYVRRSVGAKTRLPFGEVKHSPAIQYNIADMFIEVEAMRSFVRRTATRLSDDSFRGVDAVALAQGTQQFCTSTAVSVLDRALEVAGGGGYFKRTPLERMYRDVRAGKFHPLPHYDALELIGKSELGIPTSQDPRFL
ncbi:MAG: acyl-CoA dehydrogenase family protein [Dehalococcoidia bacterium]